MAVVSKVQQVGNSLKLIFDDGTAKIAVQSNMGFWKAAGLTVVEFGNMLRITNGVESAIAFPTVGGLWLSKPITGGGPGPGTGLHNYYSEEMPLTGTWEDHASYSRGGTDWGGSAWMGLGIKAPAAGTLVNYGNTDGAGLKSILIFDTTYPRKLPASSTLMNGVYVENSTDPAQSFVIQHLSGQVAAGHYNQGDVIGFLGNTAGPGSTGDTHLHAHLLAGTTIDDRRLDFMKFV